MRYSFDDVISKDYGVEAAILFEHIRVSALYHSLHKEKYGYCYQEGKWWCYNTQKELCDILHVNNVKTVNKIIKKLHSGGLILIGCFNQLNIDRTHWYTITEKSIEFLLSSNSNYDYSTSWGIYCNEMLHTRSGKKYHIEQGKNTTPIPNIINTNIINNNIATFIKVDENSFTEGIKRLTESFKEYFPIEDWCYKETALAATLEKLLSSYTESQIDDSIYIIGEHRRIVDNPIGYLVSYMNLQKRFCS